MTMQRETQQLLRLFVGEDARWQHQPLHEALLELLRDQGCQGATVVKAVAGFGHHRQIHSDQLLRLSAQRPLIVEVVDRASRIEALLPLLAPMLTEGLALVVPVEVIRFVAPRAPADGRESTGG
ncbi:DUF190 domain-containing protein [Desulfuromonas thiophila]|jgi:PII-like signaling protein|nr:DUF190 domain-containing protein [Desulfuromonas thiophila]MDD3802726.1 DUF190 domain-containing protein [Desulfuromonas thiophila]MDY0398979.1 DUF190 domain-containing protein [Desulfuromonas thiophila]